MHQSDNDIASDMRNRRSRLSAARLPVMPQVLVALIEHCQSDDTGMAAMAELIAKDAAMSAKVLELADSTGHRANQPVKLEQVLASLGPDLVRTLLTDESMSQAFGGSDASSSSGGAELYGFWRHSLAAAVSAQMIAAKIGYPHVEEAYVAGLLHDVGRLALWAMAPADAQRPPLDEDTEDACAAELRTWHMTHAEAGAGLIERWNLDSFLADSALYHHEPASRLQKAHPLIRITFLAHQLAGQEPERLALEAAAELCGIAPDDLATIRKHADEQVETAAAQFGIALDRADRMATQDAARNRLIGKVRNLVMASEAARFFSGQQDQAELQEAVMRAARLLFGFDDAALFLSDDTGYALAGTSAGRHRRRLAEFSIPLSGGAIAEAVQQRRVATIGRDGDALGVVEQQLLRILGAEHMVCLPLAAHGRCHGVLIGAVASGQPDVLRSRDGLLEAFGTQVAAALKSITDERDDINREIAGVTEKYREAARRVIHEVNNPLSIIKNYLSVLDRKLTRQEPVMAEISILNEEIDRIGQIVHGMADLKPVPRAGRTEVNHVISEVVRLFRDTEYIPPAVQIAVRLQDQPFETGGDADTLKQILVNLMKNAVEALPGGGEIAIGNNGYVNRDGQLYVELWIKDTGPGISAEVMANLFTPVRSAKGSAHRGLGLSIVHGLVKQLQGFITCRSSKKGTTFEILLPSLNGLTSASQLQFRNSA